MLATRRGAGLRLEQVEREVFFSDDPDRPVLDEVQEAARRGEFEVLLVDKVDRFSRGDLGVTAYLTYEFQRRGVQIVYVEAPDETLEGQIVRAVLAIVARVEAGKIKKRTQAGRRRRAEGRSQKWDGSRLFMGSTPLYGYQWDKHEKGRRGYYVIDEEAAPSSNVSSRRLPPGSP